MGECSRTAVHRGKGNIVPTIQPHCSDALLTLILLALIFPTTLTGSARAILMPGTKRLPSHSLRSVKSALQEQTFEPPRHISSEKVYFSDTKCRCWAPPLCQAFPSFEEVVG